MKRMLGEAGRLLLAVLLALVLAMLLRATVAETFTVPTPSMSPTVEPGDRLLAEKVSYAAGREYRAGDVLVFDDPTEPGRLLVKRVTAVAGQAVDIRSGHLWVDGERQDEPYVGGLPTSRIAGSGVYYPVSVPAATLWVMGDNREDSMDSRAFGPVPVSSVRGRVVLAYWPLSRLGTLAITDR